LAACSLALLGGFALQSTEGKDLPLPTRKDRLLFAHLALSAGRPLARDRVAGLLWGDRAETQARDSLRQSLAAIRQAFRHVGLDPITADRDSVTFEPAGIDIDAITFGRLAIQGAAPDEAARLYRGDLLEDVDSVSPEFEAWLGPEREHLAALAVRLLEQLATQRRQSHSFDEAIRLGHHLLARDRLCEPVYRALMRLHAGMEERSVALKIYATCRDALK
jgi:DNA-binding SARP family transcriptional activator